MWILSELADVRRRVSVGVGSPLTVGEARQRLAQTVKPGSFRRSPDFWLYGGETRQVFGNVDTRVTLRARKPGPNSFTRVFRGEVVESSGGSAVVGDLAVTRGNVAFSYVWLAVVTAAAFVGMSLVVAAAVAGHGAEVVHRLPDLIPVLMSVYGATAMAYGNRAGRADGEYLVAWLNEVTAG